jgi:hypothetical protein
VLPSTTQLAVRQQLPHAPLADTESPCRIRGRKTIVVIGEWIVDPRNYRTAVTGSCRAPRRADARDFIDERHEFAVKRATIATHSAAEQTAEQRALAPIEQHAANHDHARWPPSPSSSTIAQPRESRTLTRTSCDLILNSAAACAQLVVGLGARRWKGMDGFGCPRRACAMHAGGL